MTAALLLAASLLAMQKNGIELTLDCNPEVIDPARSVFVKLTLKYPHDMTVAPPDLRDRVRGFSVAEDFEEAPVADKAGYITQIANWRLVPEPVAEEYKIAPFAVTASPRLLSSRNDEGKFSFYTKPVYFKQPPPRENVDGEMEVSAKKDIPPLTWKLFGLAVAALAALCALIALVVYVLLLLARRVKEHRMSPIERAWAELGRLLEKDLPGKGRFKDFYVELTMVVRRYVQRKYGIKAPHMTTQEFLAECSSAQGRVGDTGALKRFLESADMVKFAGVEATSDMALNATSAARQYLECDSSSEVKAK